MVIGNSELNPPFTVVISRSAESDGGAITVTDPFVVVNRIGASPVSRRVTHRVSGGHGYPVRLPNVRLAPFC